MDELVVITSLKDKGLSHVIINIVTLFEAFNAPLSPVNLSLNIRFYLCQEYTHKILTHMCTDNVLFCEARFHALTKSVMIEHVGGDCVCRND